MVSAMVQYDNDSKYSIPFLRRRHFIKKQTGKDKDKSVIANRRKIRYNQKWYNVFKMNQRFVTGKRQEVKQWPIRQDFIIWFIMITTGLILLILLVRAMVQLSIEIRPLARYFTIYSIFGQGQGSVFTNNSVVSKLIRWVCSWYIT